jgi:tRNA (mo5U34)-methyltransferase
MKLTDWNHNGKINKSALKKIIRANEAVLKDKRYARHVNAFKSAKALAKELKKQDIKLSTKKELVSIGKGIDLSESQQATLKQALKDIMPWRKGPFHLLGEDIDAEWRSDLKWQRIRKVAGSLQGMRILDIGCNNGYYMYLMAKQKPKLLLGIDPTIPYYLQYQLLTEFAPLPNTDFKLLGVEDLVHFEKVFDVIFCMGILYHHSDPVGILRIIHQALRPGGMLIIESQGIKKEGSYFLMPKNRYLGAPGNWFIPSQEGLENMVRRSGFQYVNTFYSTKLETSEQRSASHSPYDSLAQSLDEDNPDLTVEGYPAPWRHYVKAIKARKRR